MMNITKPNRKKHRYTQHPNASPEAVFPRLCPVAESKWTPGWMPEVVFSVSGVVEQECIFMTTPEFPSEPQNSIWVVSNYDPSNLSLDTMQSQAVNAFGEIIRSPIDTFPIIARSWSKSKIRTRISKPSVQPFANQRGFTACVASIS